MLALTSVSAADAWRGTSHQDQVAWKEVWSDSFTGPKGTGVNKRFWKYDTRRGIFGTGEAETMTSSPGNVELHGMGDLSINAIKNAGSWTSGRIQTISTFAPPAGGEMMVTASIKQPDPGDGLGYWPAFWLLGPGTWPENGEIDIMEDVDALSLHSGTLHCGNLTQDGDGTTGPCHEPTGITSGLKPCAKCQTGYHTYSVIVDRRRADNQQIRWYLDGQQFFAVNEQQVGTAAWTQAVDHGLSIVFDLAIGGSYPDSRCGCVAPGSQTTSGGTMSVHRVAIYDSAQ
jgi:beta-glucanase (GH16 family)